MARLFRENLKRERSARGVSQEELARRLGLKRQAQVSLWETRDNVPTATTIRRIATALKCGTWLLLDDVETEYDRLRRRPAHAVRDTTIESTGKETQRAASVATTVSAGKEFRGKK